MLGLDAATALQVVQVLKDLTAVGITVVISIHAPRSDIWNQFDNVILLSSGSLMYEGPRDGVARHFEKCEYTMPAFFNPAEFMIDITSHKSRILDLKAKFAEAVEIVPSAQSSPRVQDALLTSHKLPSSFKRCEVMTKRTMMMCTRDARFLVGIGCTVGALAIVNGWIFWQLDESQRGIRSRQGSLWVATGLYGYLLLISEICRLIEDIRLFDHERRDGITSSSAFLLSRRVVKLIWEDLSLPTVFTAIYYPMVGYRANVAQICMFWLIMVLTHAVSTGVATLSVAITRNFYGAGLMGNIYFTLQTAASGYFMQVNQVPVYVKWLRWLTPTFYTFNALCINEFFGLGHSKYGYFYDCPFNDIHDIRCKEYRGAFIMNSTGLLNSGIWKQIAVLCLIVAMTHGSAFLALHFKVAKQHVRQVERPSEKDLLIQEPSECFALSNRSATLSLRDYSLQLRKRCLTLRGWSEEIYPIVGPVSSAFRPGGLNVIMGASGSGKTSLLANLAGKLSSSFRSRWDKSGHISYGGAQIEMRSLRSLVSYVPQDDQNLLPALTVRETLYFAAELELAKSTTPSQRETRVRSIITRFGLDDCADTLVGDALRRGISGGEKRRLSIACKLLTLPQIVILDEPTSGLDTYMAFSIMEFLHGLSVDGCTIILSIHQPTSAMWSLFATCLLLNQNGMPAFSGEVSDMIPYFSQAGYDCPSNMNPADFFIDIATPRFWGSESSRVEEKRVGELTSRWVEYQSKHPSTSQRSDYFDGPLEINLDFQKPKAQCSFISATPVLFHRASLNMLRSPLSLLARLIQCPGVGIIWTLFAAPLKKDYYSVQTRMGFIQQYAPLAFIGTELHSDSNKNEIPLNLGNCFTGMLQNIATFPIERDLFYHEFSERLYGPTAFLTQYTALELPMEIISATIFALLVAYAAQLGPTATEFGVCFLNALCVLNSGESLSMISAILFSNLGLAVNLTSALLGIFTALGGTMSLEPPRVLQWFNHVSPIKYAISNVSYYCLRGLVLDCTDDQRKEDGSCPIQRGEDILELYNLDTERPWVNLLAGISLMIGLRLVVFAILKLKVSR